MLTHGSGKPWLWSLIQWVTSGEPASSAEAPSPSPLLPCFEFSQVPADLIKVIGQGDGSLALLELTHYLEGARFPAHPTERQTDAVPAPPCAHVSTHMHTTSAAGVHGVTGVEADTAHPASVLMPQGPAYLPQLPLGGSGPPARGHQAPVSFTERAPKG